MALEAGRFAGWKASEDRLGTSQCWSLQSVSGVVAPPNSFVEETPDGLIRRRQGHMFGDPVYTASGDVKAYEVPVAERPVNDLPAGFLKMTTRPRAGRGEPRVPRRNPKDRR